MARNDQVIRQWQILMMIANGPVTRRKIMDELDVKKKTLRRDIDALSGSEYFPITEVQEGKDVIYSFIDGYKLPGVWFTPEEFASLSLGLKFASPALEDSSFQEDLQSVLQKIARTHSGTARRASQQLPRIYQSDFSAPNIKGDRYRELLIQAAHEQRCVKMTYFTAHRDAETERIVEPFVIRLTIHGLHLIAFCRERKAFRNFTLNRIRYAELLEQTFEGERRKFDLERFTEESFGGLRSDPVQEIKIFIKNPSAHWAKDLYYHPTQRIEQHEDGILLTFRAGGEQAIVRRVIGLGPDCELLSPPHLRGKVLDMLDSIASQYRKK